MTKSTKTTKISAAFLATVLVTGIIALVSPSFMTGAQAVPYSGMNNYKKSYDKDYRSSYAKCTNFNVNINGVEFNINDLPPGILSNLETAAADEGPETSSFGSGGSGSNGPDGSDSDNGFAFICFSINNNQGAGGGGGGGAEERECEDCFEELQTASPTVFDAVIDALRDGVTIDDFIFPPQPEGASDEEVFQAFCEQLRTSGDAPLEVTVEEIAGAIFELVGEPTEDEFDAIVDFILCLVQANVIDINLDIDTLRTTLSATT